MLNGLQMEFLVQTIARRSERVSVLLTSVPPAQ